MFSCCCRCLAIALGHKKTLWTSLQYAARTPTALLMRPELPNTIQKGGKQSSNAQSYNIVGLFVLSRQPLARAGTYKVVTYFVSRLLTPKIRATDLSCSPTRRVCTRGPPVCPAADGARKDWRPQENTCMYIKQSKPTEKHSSQLYIYIRVRCLVRLWACLPPAWRKVLEFLAV